MRKLASLIWVFLTILSVFGFSKVGVSKAQIAPYTVLQKEGDFEVRHYAKLILVSTAMQDIDNRGGAFGKLFRYISGNNQQSQSIAMTAPVFFNQLDKQTDTMSFVMPDDFSLSVTPLPNDPTVQVEHITDYTVAAIRFNGQLVGDRIEQHRQKLLAWIEQQQLTIVGASRAAGYNRPGTDPSLRRNEVMIPVVNPKKG